MKKVIFIFSIFYLICATLFSTVFGQSSKTDSLVSQLHNSLPDTQKVKTLLELASLSNKEDEIQAKIYFKEALALAINIPNSSDKGKSIYRCFDTGFSLNWFDEIIAIYPSVKEQLPILNDPRKNLLVELNTASAYSNIGRKTDAIKYFLEALRVAEINKDTVNNIIILLNLTKDYFINSHSIDTTKLHLYSRQALELSNSLGDTMLMAKSHLYRGMACNTEYYSFQVSDEKKSRLVREAIDHYYNSANFYKAIKDEVQQYATLAKLGSVYNTTERYEKALEYYLPYYKKAKEWGNLYHIMTATIYVAGVYGTRGSLEDNRMAIPYLEEALKYAKELEKFYEKIYCLEQLSKINEQLGRYEPAYNYLLEWKVIEDSTLNEQKIAELAEVETKYETEKKELTIAAQELELAQRQKVQAFTFGGLGLVGLVAFLLFRTARIRRRSNQLLEYHNRELGRKNTEIEAQKLKIEDKNQQNELLLKEIHHRVKNNLQVISSLLHLQSMHIEDAAALDAVKEGQSRVKSMALIHQKLYQGENLAAIEMQEYGTALLKSLASSFGARPDTIQMVNEIEKMEMDVERAIPLGLIINELVTNSLKYAFPDGRKGSIRLSLKETPDRQYCLEVADDGVGLSQAPWKEGSTSFGSKLVNMLTKKLKGKIEVLEDKGTVTKIWFNPK